MISARSVSGLERSLSQMPFALPPAHVERSTQRTRTSPDGCCISPSDMIRPLAAERPSLPGSHTYFSRLRGPLRLASNPENQNLGPCPHERLVRLVFVEIQACHPTRS